MFNKSKNIYEKFDFHAMLREAPMDDVIKVVTYKFLGQVNDSITRTEIENILNHIYSGIYLTRCSEVENPPEIRDNAEIQFKMVSVSETLLVNISFNGVNIIKI